MPRLTWSLLTLLLLSASSLEAAPKKGASEEAREEADELLYAALDEADDASRNGDYAAAAARLEAVAKDRSFDQASPGRRSQVRKTTAAYSRRAAWSARKTDPKDARALLVDLLIGTAGETPGHVDGRLLELIGTLRSGDAKFAKTFAPTSVHVMGTEPLAESATKRIIEQLEALGYEASSERGQVVWEVNSQARSNGDLATLLRAPTSGLSMRSCTTALSIRSSDPARLPGVPEVRATVTHINEATCQSRAAEQAGGSVGIELLRSWARANP